MKVLLSTIPTKPQFDTTINKILQGSEYKALKNPVTDFITKVKEMLQNWFFSVLRKLFPSDILPNRISGRLSIIFIIITILILFTIITVLIIKLVRALNDVPKLMDILGEKIGATTTPDSLRKKASQYEKEGNLRQAIRYDFIATLLLMHNSRLIFLDDTKTNEEIHNYLSKNDFQNLNAFEYLQAKFNYYWYGDKLCTGVEHEIWNSYLNTLWNGVIYNAQKK